MEKNTADALTTEDWVHVNLETVTMSTNSESRSLKLDFQLFSINGLRYEALGIVRSHVTCGHSLPVYQTKKFAVLFLE